MPSSLLISCPSFVSRLFPSSTCFLFLSKFLVSFLPFPDLVSLSPALVSVLSLFLIVPSPPFPVFFPWFLSPCLLFLFFSAILTSCLLVSSLLVSSSHVTSCLFSLFFFLIVPPRRLFVSSPSALSLLFLLVHSLLWYLSLFCLLDFSPCFLSCYYWW